MRRFVVFSIWILLSLTAGVGAWMLLPSSHRPPVTKLKDADQQRPSEWHWRQRTFPYYRADADAYRMALQQARALEASFKTSPFGAWELAGPYQVGGRVVDIAFDPLHPDTIYVAAATGGVFKSADGGDSWHPIFDDQAVLTIGDLAVDPLHPDTLYVGTGEANGGHNNFAGGGLYKSTDGGQTWTFLGLEETTSIGRIRIDPTNPQRVYVAAVGSYFAPNPERGIYRSTDGGQTWEHVLFVDEMTGAIDLVMRPDDPSVLFAATWERLRTYRQAQLSGAGSGIYRSTDGGTTWHRLGAGQGLPDSTTFLDTDGRVRIGRIGLAICQNQPDAMAALYTDGNTYRGLYRTDDGGTTWYDADPNDELRRGFNDFSWYMGQVRIHPNDPDQIYVMDVQFMRSADSGWTFRSGTHVDHHALAFHPHHPDTVLNGNDGGLARSTDGGATWHRLGELPVTQFYEVTIDPTNPDRLYGGTQDNGTIHTNGGASWRQLLGGDGFYVNVDPTDSDVIYAETQWGKLKKSTNGGLTFQRATTGIRVSEPTNWSTPVVMDPNDAQVLYYGTNRVYRTDDGAESWEPISNDLTSRVEAPLLGTITTIDVAPTDSDVIYVGTDEGSVWVSDDYGASWQNVTGTLPLRWVTRVVVDPTDEHTAYVTFSGLKWRDPQPHVFRTTNMGTSWHDISANLPDAPVNAFAVDPRNPAVLYLGSDVGAFASLDAGTNWQPLGDGLPAVPVYDLTIYQDETQRFLAAGTHGRSMYTLDLSSVSHPPDGNPTARDDHPAVAQSVTLEPSFPNPFTTSTTLRYHLPAPATVRLDLFDLQGRRIDVLTDGHRNAGDHTLTWDGTDAAGRPIASGIYIARLTATTSSGTTTRSLTMSRVP